MTDDQDQAQEHPRSWASIFGEEEPSIFEGVDLDAQPRPTSSAAIMAQRKAQADREAAQQRDQDVLAEAVREEADDLAVAQALKLQRAGKPVPRDVEVRAARAARARGMSRSSAERLAAQAQAARRGGH